jgi:hypothetical protein
MYAQLVGSATLASLLAAVSGTVHAAPELDILASSAFGDELGEPTRAFAVSGEELLVLGERAGQGTLVRLDHAGEPTARLRIEARVDDLAVDPRQGNIAVVGASGLQVFAPDFTLQWQRPLPLPAVSARVAIGEHGTIAALVGAELRTFSPAGAAITSIHGTDDVTRDLAVLDAEGMVVTAGWRTRDVCETRLDIASLSAFALGDGSLKWRAYGDADATELCKDGQDNLAGTRGVAVARGGDGQVYFLAEVDDRNNIFRALPGRPDRGAVNVAFDAYTDPETARPGQHAYFARFNPAGEHLLGQYFLLPADGAVVRPRAIAADRHGNVYLAGSASHTLGAADELAVSEGLDDFAAFFQVVEPDFEARRVWQQIEADDTRTDISRLVLADDRAITLMHAETGHAGDGPLPAGPSILQWDGGYGPVETKKRPDPETQGTFGYESGVSGSDPTCYCDSRSTPGPATVLGLAVFALALPRRSRGARRRC